MGDTKTRTSPSRRRARAGSSGGGAAGPSAQAAAHARTRKAHASELAEDYAETIADLIAESGEARVVDIARRIGVSHVTVVRTVARLQRDGLVTAKPYRAIFLTDSGEKLAAKSRERHRVVVDFLLSLGVPPAVAHADAEGIEHHVSPQTLAAFEKFTKSGR
jgi:DtxR family manganese transport transcriptional regulator